jgi:hypothetical protein
MMSPIPTPLILLFPKLQIRSGLSTWRKGRIGRSTVFVGEIDILVRGGKSLILLLRGGAAWPKRSESTSPKSVGAECDDEKHDPSKDPEEEG